MRRFTRLMTAEGLKLRRSAALRLTWLLPLVFVLIEWLVMERPFLGARVMTPKLQVAFNGLQITALVGLWGGFFHPLMVALLPALIFRPEHRFKAWRRLHAMPTSRRGIFLAKTAWVFLLSAIMLALVGLLLRSERMILGWLNPLLISPSQGWEMVRILGWLWLGSLPVLAIYLWVSDRINSLAMPVVFGLVGLMLTVALTGQELPQPWKRDLIPWVLPYAAAERVTHSGPAQQAALPTASAFQTEPNVLRLPSGKKVRTWQNIPDENLFPPPPPTPAWVMAFFSLAAGALILGLGSADAGRNRI